jgi:hypothetical protein
VNKKLIIALVVIVVLFIAVIIMSASHGNKKPDSPGSLSALKFLQGNRFLVLGDKASTPCASSGQTSFLMNGTCVITLESRSLFSKSTRVALNLPGGFVVVTAPKGQPTQTVTVNDGGCFGTAIPHSGGSVTLSGNGTVTILNTGCPPPS